MFDPAPVTVPKLLGHQDSLNPRFHNILELGTELLHYSNKPSVHADSTAHPSWTVPINLELNNKGSYFSYNGDSPSAVVG